MSLLIVNPPLNDNCWTHSLDEGKQKWLLCNLYLTAKDLTLLAQLSSFFGKRFNKSFFYQAVGLSRVEAAARYMSMVLVNTITHGIDWPIRPKSEGLEFGLLEFHEAQARNLAFGSPKIHKSLLCYATLSNCLCCSSKNISSKVCMYRRDQNLLYQRDQNLKNAVSKTRYICNDCSKSYIACPLCDDRVVWCLLTKQFINFWTGHNIHWATCPACWHTFSIEN